MLDVRGLQVSYGATPAVRGIDLTVAQGEVVGMVGPNGAGKSSTLKAIAGIVRRDAGEIDFDGEPLRERKPDDVARRGISLVPEGRHVFAEMSVKENLMLGMTTRRGSPDLDADLERELDRFPILRKYYRRTAGKLSGGEQQQLAIARALLSRPRLLLLDEPSLGLAPQFVDLVFEHLGQLRAEGVTMVMVEQNVARTIEFSDRTYVMRAGRMELTGTQSELEGNEQLASAYLGG